MVTKDFEGKLAREVGTHLRKCPEEGQRESRGWFKPAVSSACLPTPPHLARDTARLLPLGDQLPQRRGIISSPTFPYMNGLTVLNE